MGFLEGLKKRSQLARLQSTRSNKEFAQTCTLATVRSSSGEFTFQSPKVEDIRNLVVYFLEGLKKRSQFARLQSTRPSENDPTIIDLLLPSLKKLYKGRYTHNKKKCAKRWICSTVGRTVRRNT